jgi:hypothetical protein
MRNELSLMRNVEEGLREGLLAELIVPRRRRDAPPP